MVPSDGTLIVLSSVLLLLSGSVQGSEFSNDSSSKVVFTDSREAEIQENSRPRRFRFSEPSRWYYCHANNRVYLTLCPLRSVHLSESLPFQPLTSLSIFVPNRGCNGTYCVQSEEYPDTSRILDILDSEGDSRI